jgi:hypothetical protein
MTEGFDVFVQLVIAAMTTEPFRRPNSIRPPSGVSDSRRTSASGGAAAVMTGPSRSPPSASQRCTALSLGSGPACGRPNISTRSRSNVSRASASGTRRCGSLGPAMLGSTDAKSSSSVSEYSGSG